MCVLKFYDLIAVFIILILILHILVYIYAVRLGAAKIDLVIQYWDLYSFDEILCRKKIKWYHLMLYIYDLYVNVFYFQWICTLLLQFHFKVGYQY